MGAGVGLLDYRVPVIGMLGAVLASRVAGRALPPGWGRAVLHAALSLGWLCVSVGLMYSLGDAHTTHETPLRGVTGPSCHFACAD